MVSLAEKETTAVPFSSHGCSVPMVASSIRNIDLDLALSFHFKITITSE